MGGTKQPIQASHEEEQKRISHTRHEDSEGCVWGRRTTVKDAKTRRRTKKKASHEGTKTQRVYGKEGVQFTQSRARSWAGLKPAPTG